MARRQHIRWSTDSHKLRRGIGGEKRGWIRIASIAVLTVAFPIFSTAQTTTLDWEVIGELRGTDRQRLTGSFVGVHQGALLVAGGVNLIPAEGQDGHDKMYRHTIQVATRGQGTDTNRDGKIMAGERPLTWHDTSPTLPDVQAWEGAASHSLGVILSSIDGRTERRDLYLLRWNANTERLSQLALPVLSATPISGDVAIIDNTLFRIASRTGESSHLYALDLSRLMLDTNGNPLAEGDIAKITTGQDVNGVPVSPWQRLSPLPDSLSEHLVRSPVTIVAQSDNLGDRLYVFGGLEGNETWAFDPSAKLAVDTWQRKSDIGVDGEPVRLSSARAIPFGRSHIFLLMNAEDPALSYNTITNTWTSYDNARHSLDIGIVADHGTQRDGRISGLVNWQDDIIAVTADTQQPVSRILLASVKGPERNFGGLNMAVLIIYLLAMVLVGAYFAFKNNSTDDYFRGGQHIPWWAAACSIYATMLSSLTYVALPALVYRTDWLVYIGTMMILVVAPVAVYIAMPFFRQIDATSAYEYLSKRFNLPVRLFASGLFTLFHIGRMGIVMALTALALAAVTPLDAWQCVLIMGMLCMIYCTLGGVEAVIWTDTIQTLVLLIGAIVCFSYIIAGIDGGFSGFINSGLAANKLTMVNWDFGPNSITTLSIWVIVLGGIGQNLSSYTADQAVVQRYMVTTDTQAAARSIWANAVLAVPGALLFFCIGTGLYSFYQSQPDRLDPTIQIDQIFPVFIATELPIGIAGLIVAGIFAAAQSTVSTSMNSLATTLVTDFMRPFSLCHSETAYFNVARVLTFTMGVLGTLAGLLFISPEIRSLMEEYFKVIGMFMGALGGLFVLGVSTRRANGPGAIVGILAGVSVMVLTWQNQWADGYLFATIGILTCLVVGYFASCLLSAEQRDLNGLTLYTMQKV